jgi:hypothetical protein
VQKGLHLQDKQQKRTRTTNIKDDRKGGKLVKALRLGDELQNPSGSLGKFDRRQRRGQKAKALRQEIIKRALRHRSLEEKVQATRNL